MQVRVYTEIDVPWILRKRGLSDDNPRVRRAIASQVARLCKPYCPKDSGDLQKLYTITSDGRQLIYDVPYARFQYYNNKGGRNGPLRGPKWEKRMLADKKDELVKWIEKYIGGGQG